MNSFDDPMFGPPFLAFIADPDYFLPNPPQPTQPIVASTISLESAAKNNQKRKRPAEEALPLASPLNPSPKKQALQNPTSTTANIQTRLGSVPWVQGPSLNPDYCNRLNEARDTLLLSTLVKKQKEQLVIETFLRQIEILRQSPEQLIQFLNTPFANGIFNYLFVKAQNDQLTSWAHSNNNAPFFQTATATPPLPAPNPNVQQPARPKR